MLNTLIPLPPLLTSHLSLLTPSAAYIPFVTPLPLWGIWWVLLFPLVAAVAVVYKTIKVRRMDRLAVEATQLAVVILLAMFAGAAALTVLVKVVLG